MKKAIAHLRQCDPRLDELIRRAGPLRPHWHPACFETLARSIVFQQLNGRAASTIFNRLAAACGDEVSPETLLRLTPARMRKLGVSPQKTTYLRDLARRTASGELDFAELPRLSDAAVIERLTVVKGVGVWTAQMFLIFALRRPDVLPTSDYGIRVAMKNLYELPDLPKPPQMEERARPWRPWASVACLYLWRSLDGPVGV